ncbi:MAG: hypothetical protein CL398_08540 [Acidiferrobacteraceae bacterium]|nr:hypothetical protein [Acidiferrobacteraceae bacterium]|tara:strand:+ start:638 stop:1468 length:831 start_codon:yes stop_codon:yes gene_type:complete
MKPIDLINLDLYPLDRLETPAGHKLVTSIRDSLELDGSCTLPDFVTANALQAMRSQAISLADKAYSGPTSASPYFFNYDLEKELDIDVDRKHPLRRKGKRNLRQIAADLIPGDHLLSVLYCSDLMTQFLSRVLDKEVFRNQDKYQSLNISLQNEGGCQQWHFDTGDMVTTLLLQSSESGGIFEYYPRIRSEDDENFEEVRKVLDGISNRVKQLHLRPGMLSLFQGRNSIHRVTEIRGSTCRIQAILGYATSPNVVGSTKSSILHYGPRVALRENTR